MWGESNKHSLINCQIKWHTTGGFLALFCSHTIFKHFRSSSKGAFALFYDSFNCRTTDAVFRHNQELFIISDSLVRQENDVIPETRFHKLGIGVCA